MVVDYRERKQVSKNRPKSKPTGVIVVVVVTVSLVSFALGVLTDRYLLPPCEQKATPASQARGVASQQVPQQTPPPQGSNTASAPMPPRPAAEPSLTFYDTLPKGGKAILGSGINPRKEEIRSTEPAKQPAAPPHPLESPSQPAAKTASPAGKAEPGGASGQSGNKPASESGKESQEKKASTPKGKFSVQVASSKERKEAEAIRSKLVERGFASYIVESTVAGKGTWYRVKVGKQMDQAAASDMASMLGKGAIVIPE